MTATGTIRPVQPRDLDDLYDICLRTGDNGVDATDLYRANRDCSAPCSRHRTQRW